MGNGEAVAGSVRIEKSTVTAEKIIGNQIGLDEKEMLELFEKRLPKAVQESMKSALPSISQEAAQEALTKILGEDFPKSFWVSYLAEHIFPLYPTYGRGRGVKIALIGEELGQMDESTKTALSLKGVVSIVPKGEKKQLNLVPVVILNSIAPESEIYYLNAVPGRISDIIMSLQWCVDNKMDIVAILASVPRCKDGGCPICQASRNLILGGVSAVVSMDQGCPKPVLDGMIPVGGVVPTGEGVVLLRKDNTASFAKVLAWARIQACNLTALVTSNTQPLFVRNIQDLTSDSVSVVNVCGVLALVASHLKMTEGKASPADLEGYLKKSLVQVPLATGGGVGSFGLLEPKKLLEL